MIKDLDQLTDEDAFHIAKIALFIDKDSDATLISIEDDFKSIPKKRIKVHNPQIDEDETIVIDATYDVWEEERLSSHIPVSNQVDIFKYLQEKGYI